VSRRCLVIYKNVYRRLQYFADKAARFNPDEMKVLSSRENKVFFQYNKVEIVT